MATKSRLTIWASGECLLAYMDDPSISIEA